MVESLASIRIEELFRKYSYAGDFFNATGINITDQNLTLNQLLSLIRDDLLQDIGLDRDQILDNLGSFIDRMERLKNQSGERIQSITILGGQDKSGNLENIDMELRIGEVISIVGPTGSGKSRLLADIECLAQRDTPTFRQVLVNHAIPDRNKRFTIENKLVAQLSQNMNFVMDLSAEEFIRLHAESRMVSDTGGIAEEIIYCANELAGEKFGRNTPLTQLSGGQSRALMIADTALLSVSPIVLIDEIENAGIDRRKAVKLLVKKEKLVLISTHDPVLALIGDKRMVIKNGGISRVIVLTQDEKKYIDILEGMDKKLQRLRNHIRMGGIIDDTVIDF